MHPPSQFNLNTLTCTLIGLTFAFSHVARAYPMLSLEGSLEPRLQDLGSRDIALDPRDDLTGIWKNCSV
ncbi:hypothetical protein K474DRAFT_1668879 [Panus rudis PR-1116 ss-1]|nr:hypothetical protein K474DRAFT_1668879 [Panus rudis PR-1116 ss-1]